MDFFATRTSCWTLRPPIRSGSRGRRSSFVQPQRKGQFSSIRLFTPEKGSNRRLARQQTHSRWLRLTGRLYGSAKVTHEVSGVPGRIYRAAWSSVPSEQSLLQQRTKASLFNLYSQWPSAQNPSLGSGFRVPGLAPEGAKPLVRQSSPFWRPIPAYRPISSPETPGGLMAECAPALSDAAQRVLFTCPSQVVAGEGSASSYAWMVTAGRDDPRSVELDAPHELEPLKKHSTILIIALSPSAG